MRIACLFLATGAASRLSVPAISHLPSFIVSSNWIVAQCKVDIDSDARRSYCGLFASKCKRYWCGCR